MESSREKQNSLEIILPKPMTYSESVKQPKPQSPTSSNEQQISAKVKLKAKIAGKLAKERSESSKSTQFVKMEIKKAASMYDSLISEKEKVIRNYIDQVNEHLLLLKPVFCNRKNCNHEQSSCIPAHRKITELNDKIARKVFVLRNSITKLKEMVCVLRERKERKMELIWLFTNVKKDGEDGMVVKYRRKYYEENYKQLISEHERLLNEITEAEELCFSSEPIKAEEFMKNCIRTLANNVKCRSSALRDIEQDIQTAQKIFDEKRSNLNYSQEEIKRIRKELSEPIINRIQYNLCLKENLKYDQDLNEVLKERDAVQHQYGSIMEEFKALQFKLQAEEISKEKLFMEIMSQIEEGRNYEIEHEGMIARINQMHAEIAVRHGFMHARQKSIDEISVECEELKNKLLVAVEEEEKLKRKNKKIGADLTDVLFDICFSISWMAAGEEIAEKEGEDKMKKEEKV